MQRRVAVLVLAVLLAGIPVVSAIPSVAAQGSPSGAKAAAFRAAMRVLWGDHVTWTRTYLISAIAGLPDAKPTAERLLRNQADIGNAVKPFYGEAAGAKLTALLRDHILTAAGLVTGCMSSTVGRRQVERAVTWMARRGGVSRRGLGAAAVEAILDNLGSHSSTRERQAAAAIEGIGPDAFPYLLRALCSHPNAFARAVAARCLQRFGARAEPRLLRALRDPAMPVRLSALLALEQLWDAKVETSVIRLLRDPSAGIRHNASRVVARHHAIAAVPALTSLLSDPVWHVRQQAALALGKLGVRRTAPDLWRATSDPRPAVRNAARDALKQIGAV